MQRLGLTRIAALKYYPGHKAKVDTFVEQIWKAQFGRLKSDINALQLEFAKLYASGRRAGQPELAAIKSTTDNPERQRLKSRRDILARFENAIMARNRSLAEGEVARLYEGAEALLEAAFVESGLARAEFRNQLVRNAQAYDAVSLPEPLDVQNGAKQLAGVEVSQATRSNPVTLERLESLEQQTRELGLRHCDRIEANIRGIIGN